MNSRNIDILSHIVRYCDEINEAGEHFGKSAEALKSGSVYKNAATMCILQIGELVGHLSDDFKAIYSEMPWQNMRAMRNVAAHQYNTIDVETLWETIETDIPALRDYCNDIIHRYEILEQPALEEADGNTQTMC